MLIIQDELAAVSEARAYQLDDLLLVRVAGRKPTACHLVTVERSLTDVEPPAFVARLALDPRARCRHDAEPVDYEVAQAFRIGAPREEVVVHHAGGTLPVGVAPVTVDGGLAARASGEGARTRPPFLPDTEPSEAVGYSRDYDLGEAIQDAIRQLPEQAPGVNDWLSTYSVVSIGAEIGGIAGFNHLKVVVRG